MAIPPAFHGWYKSNYPTLVFNPEWLNACVEYLQSTDAQCNSTTSALIKAVETQLLSSDLSTSVSLASPLLTQNRATLSTLTPANASERDRIIFGGGKRGSALFQVEKVDDVGHSASSLLEIVREKQEWNKLKLKGGGAGVDQGRDMRLDDEEDHPGEGAIDEEEKRILAGGTGQEPRFPRGSGKFVLSDGANLVVAFELQRIQALGLEEIKLGTKLLIHDAPFVNGIMLLTPQNTVVKGHDVEELEQFSAWTLENSLRERLELEPLPKPVDAPNRSPPARSPTPPKPDVKPTPQARAQPSVQTQARAGPSTSRAQPPRAPIVEPDESFGDEFDLDDDDDGIDYDALQAQALAQSQQRTKPRSQGSAGKGKERVRDLAEDFDPNDFDQDAPGRAGEDDDEEGWNMLNEMEQTRSEKGQASGGRGAGKTSKGKGGPGGVSVKLEPRSSGSGTSRTRTRVEVLELDSDDGEEPDGGQSRAPATKRAKENRKEEVTVLELDDSSD
ncbi:hypothetical protein JCM11491_002621 [Sporobolomyces phaffii]